MLPPLPAYGLCLDTPLLCSCSNATLGIAITLAQQGLLPLSVGVAFVLGSNIGTTVAPLLAAVPKGASPLKFALAYVGFKTVTALLALTMLPWFTDAAVALSGGDTANVPAVIAAAHAVFNAALVVVFFPFLNSIAALLQRVLGVEDKGK